ncbi:DUF2357 domain-containing protein [Ureibacillus terrenus]|uniref:DUF2357 domain-containing protein n=1 Tax=Ureibacillus terrenus TaxID=118246 RepID=A0A540V5F0_9BACL|nr:DUF2357 domain-containing protein [Ureibacillus terrenus]
MIPTKTRYIKITLERLKSRIENLLEVIQKPKFDIEPDQEVIKLLNKMKNQVLKKLKTPFWQNIGRLDRPVMSMVLQMDGGTRCGPLLQTQSRL